MNKIKRIVSVLAAAAVTAALAGCSGGEGFDSGKAVTVISREESSGTRGAFIELFGIEEKNDAGEKVDRTIDTASVTQSTGVMKTTVSQNEYAIGYISMGALDDTVKAVKIDGADATVDNVVNSSYKISRPFNIVTKEGVSPLAQDFIGFILSADGQAVVAEEGYISVPDTGAYSGAGQSGKITIGGSSSVTPVMEKLRETYIAVNPDVTVEINQSDSTTGVNSVIEGICDIGMASRELKDSETAAGAASTVIATDGIAVIVSNDNPVTELTSDEVKNIYTGAVTTWETLVD